MRYLSLLLPALLVACAVGPDYERPALDLPPAYAASVPAGEGGVWWEGFDDPVLSELIVAALGENLTIEAAEARLRRAEALAVAARSDFFPIIDGQVSGVSSRGQAPSAEAGLSLFFLPDIFGQTRRSFELARAQVESAEAQRADAARITAFLTAAAYLELRRTEARLALLDQSLDLQEQTLRIVSLRADAGLAADLDVRRAAADLARTRAQRGPLAAARNDAALTLAVLRALPPGTPAAGIQPTATLPGYEGGPTAGLPADLLRRRPDIRAAEAALAAATAAIGIEAADLYPQLVLNGSLAESIAGAAMDTRRLSGLIDVPLFDAGRRRAEVRAARATADSVLADYRLTVLDALREVESALVGIEAAEARQRDLRAATEASEAAFDQLQALYREGLASLIDVLDAQRQLISAREAFTDSDAALAQAYVQFYTALGGEDRRGA